MKVVEELLEKRGENRKRRKRRKGADRAARTLFIALAAILLIAGVLYLVGGRRIWSRMYSGTGLTETLPEASENTASVYFFDVGQGNSSLIIADGKNILIDSGEYDMAGRIISYLRVLGVERLDSVFVTHLHSDHIGGLAEVMSAVRTDRLIMPDAASDSGSYNAVMREVKRADTSVMTISENTVIDIGDGGYFEIFRSHDNSEEKANTNNDSIVIKYVYGGTSFLFCGDIEEEAERELLNSGADLDSDVIMVPHHGSATSDSREFVESVSPDYAVISVGESNDYGHPHRSTLRLYTQSGVKIYRTDTDGNIAAFSDGNSIQFAA